MAFRSHRTEEYTTSNTPFYYVVAATDCIARIYDLEALQSRASAQRNSGFHPHILELSL